MSCCRGGSSTTQEPSYIAQLMRDAKAELQREVKLLLLGPGESGKSTLFKQFKIIFSSGFSADELALFKPIIHANAVSAMQALLAFVEERGLELGSQRACEARDVVQALSANDCELTPAIAAHIKRLWLDPGVQEAFERRSEFQLIDSAVIFFSEVDRIAHPMYIPTARDALTCRARTTGIVELQFQFDNVAYRVMDVGGQRSERKKWIHCFDAADAQLLTSRGFLLLDQLLRLVRWRRCAATGDIVVVDWRGMRAASYDINTHRLVWREPRALVVNEQPAQRLIELTSVRSKVSVLATPQHQLYVRVVGERCWRKQTCADVMASAATTPIEFLAAPAGKSSRKRRRPLLVDSVRWHPHTSSRTWCFDNNDGFVVHRRAGTSGWRPTVQGNCFADVTAIIFVASLSGYDLTLVEAAHRNRMLEAIELFDEICNAAWFVNTALILFLNKSDLFRDKIARKVPLTDAFPHYNGKADDYDEALRFIRAEFLQRNRDTSKAIYPHVTCATDTRNIEVVFNAMTDIVLRAQLDAMGV